MVLVLVVQKVWGSKFKMQKIWLCVVMALVALLGMFYPYVLPFVFVLSLLALGYFMWEVKQKGFHPQSDTYKKLEKIKKKRLKTEAQKHKHIHDQVAYIAKVWGYTKEQEKIINKFIETRAYAEMYNRFTASLLPQIITLIDNCNARERKGCKREVSKRLKELSDLMKLEFKKQKFEKVESFETSLIVYDTLLQETQ